MNAEEDDYMSEDILQQCVEVRPGLVFSQKTKRLNEIAEKHQFANKTSRTKSRNELENEKREAGLSCPISSDNKGFALMQKMGYKPGLALGKRGAEGGLKEPIPINLKSDRTGLGRETFVQHKLNEMRSRREKKKVKLSINTQEYRRHMRNKFAERQTAIDLKTSQKACEHLDIKLDISEPPEKWFWFSRVKDDSENVDEESDDDDDESNSSDEEEAEFEPSEMLEILTSYLRKIHKYCIWCGTSYDDDEDLQSNCPGNTADDH